MLQTDIFVVDDEYLIGQTLGLILRRAGYRTEVFNDPHTALRRLTQPPRLILSDHRMPTMSGCAMASLFLQADPETRVLMFSANLTEAGLEWQLVHRQARHSHLIAKPLHPHHLLAIVHDMLELPACPRQFSSLFNKRHTAVSQSPAGDAFHHAIRAW